MPRTVTSAPGKLFDLGRFDIPDVARQRRVRVYLPARAPKNGAPRPVLYMFDGQNVFDDQGSFSGGWYVHRAVDKYGARRARPPVVVAIDHGGEARIDELTPFGDGRRGGKAEAFVGWIASYLAPRLRNELNLSQEPKGTLVGGSSLGGLCALYSHFRFPEIFGGAMCMSPSLWFGGRRIFEFVGAQGVPWTSNIYLDAGTREARGGMVAQAEQLTRELRARGYGDDRLRFRADARGNHNESSWRRRFPGALRYLLG